MTDAVNGTAKPMVIRTVIQCNPGACIRYTDTSGRYLGSLQFDCSDIGALAAMGVDFQAFTAEQTGGVQIASGVPDFRILKQ